MYHRKVSMNDLYDKIKFIVKVLFMIQIQTTFLEISIDSTLIDISNYVISYLSIFLKQ